MTTQRTIELPQPNMESGNMLVNIGPQHPATHGVLRLLCELDGETVVNIDPDIGYLHSSFEKLGEFRTWNQIIPLTDRMDYLAPLMYNCVYVMAVEKLMGLEVTERCKIVRVLCMEMERIFSHLLWLGTTAIDVGAFTPFLYAFQERERIYKLHEAFTGARITTSATRIGGMMADLPEGWTDQLKDFVDTFPDTLDEIEDLLTRNGIHLGRTQGIGCISANEAINAGFTGPNLRASGVDYDLRKDRPYYDYETYEFDVPVGTKGDCYDRYLVRMEEMRQSLKIIEQAIEQMEPGPTMAKVRRLIRPPKGEVYVRSESPRGDLGVFLISDGSDKPYRIKVRAPSFTNLQAIEHMLLNAYVADAVVILGSIDIILGEVDR